MWRFAADALPPCAARSWSRIAPRQAVLAALDERAAESRTSARARRAASRPAKQRARRVPIGRRPSFIADRPEVTAYGSRLRERHRQERRVQPDSNAHVARTY